MKINFTFSPGHKSNYFPKLFKKYLFLIMLLFTSTSFCQTATAPAGAGTIGNPYQIATLENLYWIAAADDVVPSPTQATRWASYYIQTANINASETSGWFSGQGWSPIGKNSTNKFSGNYNGNGYYIDGLYINRTSTDSVGLFGYIQSATIQNLGVTNVNISGKSNVGGLVGYAYSSTITKCYSTGGINGSVSAIGGLVGYSFVGTSISLSYSSCNVTSTASSEDWVGGLIGVNNHNGVVTNCYSSGKVVGYSRVGGLIGYHINGGSALVSKSYSTGEVTGTSTTHGFIGSNLVPTSECFWDTQTSGYSTSTNGAVGKTTAEMKTQSTFTDAGWDFIVETDNGTNDYWEMNAGFNSGYPILEWQSVEVPDITTTPIIISNSNIGFTAQSGSVSLSFVEMNSTPTNLPEEAVTINKYWEISDVTGGDVKLRLYYLPALTTSFTGTPKIIHYNGTSWEVLPTEPYVTVGLLRYVETTNYYSSFSPVTIGDENSPLPVEMTSFSASINENKIELIWQTATEVNNFGFEIERLIKNEKFEIKNWETIGFVEGNGNSNSPKEYSFTDNNLNLNLNLTYRLKQIDNDGKYSYSDVVEVELNNIPTEYSLYQNYPNPFNPSTTIKFGLPIDSKVVLEVYNIVGQKVKTLINNENKTAGYHQVNFNGNELATGIYIYRLTANDFTSTKKFVLMK